MAVMAASPSPGAAPRTPRHPPYKEMIVSAIGTLRERKGSSRQAIAKYILSNYSDLPSKHDALLATHLHRLKASGLLRMVSHSYKLSSSSSAAASGASNPASAEKPRGRPRNLPVLKKSGRPPKGLLAGPDAGRTSKARPLGEKRKPGRPKKVLAALVPFRSPSRGLHSEKRKPGRPKKSPLLAELILPESMKAVLDTKLVALTPVGEKRKAGRPPKVKPLTEKQKPGRPKKGIAALVPRVAPSRVIDARKRNPGRPKRIAAESVPLGSPSRVIDSRKKPGRPKKVSAALVPVGLSSRVTDSRKRKPGRPKKISTALVPLGSPSKVLTSRKRKPGRPPKAESLSGKRKPGRPGRVSAALVVMGSPPPGVPNSRKRKSSWPGKNPSASLIPSGEKRKRGRPKKGSLVPMLVTTEAAVGGLERPPAENTARVVSAAVENGGADDVKSGILLTENGVGKVLAAVGSPVAAGTALVEKRKRGRPPKESSLVVPVEKFGLEKRSVGRPRKKLAT